MNAERNKRCRENPEGCYTCECSKHHNCKEGADECCKLKKSYFSLEKCNCRHCQEALKLKDAKQNLDGKEKKE